MSAPSRTDIERKSDGESAEADLTSKLLSSVLSYASSYYRGLRERHVNAEATQGDMMAALNVDLTENGEDPQQTIAALIEAGEMGTVASSGPRYFGFVVGGSVPVSTAADWLTGVWDQNAGIYVLSPFAAVTEEVASRWLLEIFGLPRTSSVGFVTGCQAANLVGLAAARASVLQRAGWNVGEQGLQGAPEVHVVVGEEAHITIFGALSALGLGKARVKRVPADDQGRMRADELRALLKRCTGPTIVCAQAGNVNTGSFDPLRQIGEACREHGAWLHVDGAFGLWAAASPKFRPLVDGIDLADSWATDAHKWLNVPYDSGLAIVRHPEAHVEAYARRAAYLPDASAMRDNYVFTPEFSRRARGITVYAAIRSLGRKGISELVERCCRNATLFAEFLARHPQVKILNDVVLNQVLVQFVPTNRSGADEFTKRIMEKIQQDGTCWMGGTVWKGKYAMRISVSSWMTTEADVRRSADAILSILQDELEI